MVLVYVSIAKDFGKNKVSVRIRTAVFVKVYEENFCKIVNEIFTKENSLIMLYQIFLYNKHMCKCFTGDRWN